ncbi:MAG: hypothetical protein O2787_06120 [Cyanobacteria bacterium]|nr:hypothetical protein [Cyanobacteriota bacterium]
MIAWMVYAMVLAGSVRACRHAGVVLIDAHAANPAAGSLLLQLGFAVVAETLRMYRSSPPAVPLSDIYGLACLELG